ncbi:MAG: hypothetical protein WBO36_06995 [Saprospiraceae bacterium]
MSFSEEIFIVFYPSLPASEQAGLPASEQAGLPASEQAGLPVSQLASLPYLQQLPFTHKYTSIDQLKFWMKF